MECYSALSVPVLSSSCEAGEFGGSRWDMRCTICGTRKWKWSRSNTSSKASIYPTLKVSCMGSTGSTWEAVKSTVESCHPAETIN